jgi:Secretion system C-terminal sorting domain/Subtilase family
LNILTALQNGVGIFKLHHDCMHVRAGGTSIASPAVAGTVALYFQKCHTATHTEVMHAITFTATSDSITGSVPNNRYGNGRLDAFSALNSSNYPVFLDPAGVVSLCEGDSALVLAPSDSTSYFWSDNTFEQGAWSQGEPLSVTVTNPSGCAARSDTTFFTMIPAPAPPIITANGLDLSSSSALTYQWFLEGAPIAGATAQQWTAQANGVYTVQITDTTGCAAFSDTLNVFSVGIRSIEATSLSVWPVPARGLLNVTYTIGDAAPFAVVDATGKQVITGRIQAGNTRAIDISGLAPGTYVLRIQDRTDALQRSFVVR